MLLQIPDLTPLDTGKPLIMGDRPEETTRVPGLEDTTMGTLRCRNSVDVDVGVGTLLQSAHFAKGCQLPAPVPFRS